MEAFFQLRGRPFAAAPRTDRYFAAASIENARRTLLRAVDRAEGPAVVIGAVGTGKSLLCRLIAEQFRDTFRVALVAGGRIDSRRSLWQAILFELRLPFRGMDDGELRLALVGHLTANTPSTQPVLLIVDEAHLLTPRLLDELRILADLVPEGQSSSSGQTAVRLILAGGPGLEERFAHPKLENFSQRLCARCFIEPLTHEETSEYIRAQLAACNATADGLFDAAALDAAFRATDGVPRLVNQVCDHALVLAYSEGQPQVTSLLVDEAWADLQQLPTPWSVQSVAAPVRRIDDAHRKSPDTAGFGAVEFGELDEQDDFAASVPFRKGFSIAPANPDGDDGATASDSNGHAATPYDLAALSADESFDAQHLPAFGGLEPPDYTPPTGQPEVEISTTAETIDPFGEDFLEEEPVVDRFPALHPPKSPAAATICPKTAAIAPPPVPPAGAPAYDANHFAAYEPGVLSAAAKTSAPSTPKPTPAPIAASSAAAAPSSIPSNVPSIAPLAAESSALPWASGEIAAFAPPSLGANVADDRPLASPADDDYSLSQANRPTPFDLSYGHAGSDFLQLRAAKTASAVAVPRGAAVDAPIQAAVASPDPLPLTASATKPFATNSPPGLSRPNAPARPQAGGDLKHLFTRLRRSGTH
jgi:type II secretory pathway predicted ATPase ExeA